MHLLHCEWASTVPSPSPASSPARDLVRCNSSSGPQMSQASGSAGGFLPFLAQDNADLTSPSTQAALHAINQDLSQLLRLPPAQFWTVAAADQSLHTCLDSFLRFRRRCYDEQGAVQGSSDLLQQLSQRVFRVFWRMVHAQQQEQQQQQQQVQPPSAGQVADLLYDRWLLDVPKMMDLAVLFGPGSSRLTQQLLQQLLHLQPKYAQDLFDMSAPLTANLHELLESVKRLGGQMLKAAPGSTAAAAPGSTAAAAADSKQLLSEVAGAVSFFTDACLTLQALVECLPEAAALLLHPAHHGELLVMLAAVYSSTLPLVARVAAQPAAAAVPGLAAGRLQRLQQCLESLVYHLLRAAFCTKAGAAAASGPGAIAASAAGGAGSSSSKRPPPGYGGSSSSKAAAAGAFDAETQGQELMNLLMLLAHPSDALPQQQQHSSSSSSGGPAGNLLAALNHAHHLDVAVSAAVAEGLLLLDDAQFDYFLALVDGDRELLHQRQQQQRHSSAAGAAAAAGASSSSSSSSQALPADLPARVAAIRELLPDYGDGFLTAALFHSSFDSERVINCLLEGSLPPALQGLDPGLQRWTPPASAAAVNGAPGATAGAGLSWTGLAREAAAAAAPVPREHVPLPSLAAAAAAGPRPAIDRRTGRVLGALGGRVRDATRSIAHEMQYEYDDEYDDSFDDLTGPGNDGVCDIEGEDNSSSSARPARGPARGPAAAGDEYADEPAGGSSSGGGRRLPGGQQQQQQQQRQQRRPETLYVLDGKVYNYKKAGAQEVVGQAGAKAAVKAAQHAALEIHGLGPGGNVPLSVADVSASGDRRQQHQQYQQHQQVPAGGGGSGGSGGRGGRGPGGGRGGGSSQQQQQEDAEDGGGGGRGGGRGRGRGSFTHKEAHKAAIGNHHRKDRAAAKAGRGMF